MGLIPTFFSYNSKSSLILDALVYNTSDGYEIISLMSERKQLEKYLTPTSGVVTEFN